MDERTRNALAMLAIYGTIAALALRDLWCLALEREWRAGHSLGWRARGAEIAVQRATDKDRAAAAPFGRIAVDFSAWNEKLKGGDHDPGSGKPSNEATGSSDDAHEEASSEEPRSTRPMPPFARVATFYPLKRP